MIMIDNAIIIIILTVNICNNHRSLHIISFALLFRFAPATSPCLPYHSSSSFLPFFLFIPSILPLHSYHSSSSFLPFFLFIPTILPLLPSHSIFPTILLLHPYHSSSSMTSPLNPPSLLFFLFSLLVGVKKKKFAVEVSDEEVPALLRLFPALFFSFPFVLLSFSFRSPFVLLSFSFRSPFVLVMSRFFSFLLVSSLYFSLLFTPHPSSPNLLNSSPRHPLTPLYHPVVSADI